MSTTSHFLKGQLNMAKIKKHIVTNTQIKPCEGVKGLADINIRLITSEEQNVKTFGMILAESNTHIDRNGKCEILLRNK